MASRVNATEVKEIIDTTLSDVIVTSFIDMASRFIDEILSPTGHGLDALRLADVELWLSAHFVAMRDQDEGMTTQQGAGDANTTYSGAFGKGLESTRYGQMAIFLDTSGKLAATGTQIKARFAVVAPVDTL